MANIVHRLISGVLELRPEPAVSCATGRSGRALPLALFAFLLAVSLAPGAHAATLMHNSDNVGTKYGTWGIAGAKYGQFTCTTCHEPGAANIKRVKGTVTVPDPVTYGNIPGSTVSFQSITSFGDDSNNHTTSQRICEVCHSQTTHHRYDVTPLSAAQKNHNNRLDCTTASCHPHSKAFAAGGCDGCHGNPPTTNNADNSNNTGLVWSPSVTGATSPLSAGGHIAHNNRGYACTVCHNGNTMPTVSYTLQMGFNFYGANRAGTFTGYTSLPNGYTFASSNPGTTVLRRNNYNNSCANLYCHGGGDSVNGKAALTGGSNKVPFWSGASQAACGTCHATDTTYNATGSHNKHLSPTLMSALSCSKCHGVISNNNHVDGAVFWKLSTSWNRIGASATYDPAGAVGPGASGDTAAVAPSASFGTCNNLYCHSSGAGSYQVPTWGGSLPADCSGCHGANRVAATKISTNVHLAHINYTTSVGKYIGCAECHAATASSDTVIGTPANHSDYSVNVKFDNSVNADADKPHYANMSTNRPLGAYKAPLTAVGNCTNVYCHSNGNISGTTPTFGTIAWNAAAIDCADCHGDGASKAHSVFTNGGAGTVTANSHVKHVESSGLSCDYCHIDTVSETAVPPTKVRTATGKHINRAENVRFKAFGGYTGNYISGSKTCSSTYCHGSAPSVAWGGSTNCNSCHAAKSNDAFWSTNSAHKLHVSTALQTTFNNMSGNVSTAGIYRFTCAACHDPASVTHSGGVATANRAAQVAFGRYTGVGAGATAYNEGTTQAQLDNGYEWTNGGTTSCYTSYCHSNGQSPRTNGTAINWATTTSSGSCSICHGNGTAGNALSGRHDKHVNNVNYLGSNIKCADCHEKTLTAGTDFTIADKRLHVNKFRDYSGSKAYKTDFNTGTKVCANTYCHSNGKQGTGVSYVASVTWTTAAVTRYSCKSCHGNVSSTYGEPGYANGGVGTTANNHTIHVVTKQITCDKCHRNTVKLSSYTTLLATNTAHLNKNIQDVAFNSYSVNGRGYTTGTKTCNNIYCHSNGKGGYVNPVWGQTTLNCGGCHAINSLSVGHRFHIYTSAVPTLFNYTANKSTSLRYNYGCAICHPVVSTGHNNGSVELNLMPGEANTGWLKTKNSASVTASGVVGTANSGTYGTPGTSVKCMNVYCHSNGYTTTFKFYTSPEWYTSAGAPADKCAMCHSNSPNSGNRPGSPSHYNSNWLGTGQAGGHAMGIHAMKISKGANFVSLMTPGTTDPSSHGTTATATATTINCDTCHSSVVTSSANDKNAFCTTCHNGTTAPLKGNAAIADKSKHSNGTVAVAFKTTTVYSKAQLRDASFSLNSSSTLWHRNNSYKANNSYDSSKQNLNVSTYAAGSCTTICHFNKPVNWSVTPGSVSCQSCHTSM